VNTTLTGAPSPIASPAARGSGQPAKLRGGHVIKNGCRGHDGRRVPCGRLRLSMAAIAATAGRSDHL